MRCGEPRQGGMWSDIQPEQWIPQDHPLYPFRVMVDRALKDSPRALYCYTPTPAGPRPPEQPLQALLLQAIYSVRSE